MRSPEDNASLVWRAFGALLPLVAALLLLSGSAFGQGSWTARTAPWSTFAQGNDNEPAGLQTYTSSVQDQLNRLHCYADDVDNIDAVWGPESRQALDRLRKRIGSTFPFQTTGRGSAENFLAYLQSAPDGQCGGGAARQRATDRVCRRSEVGRSYLTDKAGEAKEANALSATLDRFNEAFDRIFKPGDVDATKGWDNTTKDRLEIVAGNRVTHASAKSALEAAAHQLRQLSFAYGLSKFPACGVCYQINDWIYLRNMAQSSGGQLMFVESRQADRKAFIRADVSRITEKMLAEVAPFIRIHRGASANLELHFGYLEPNGLPQGMDRTAVAGRIPALIAARDEAMRDIVFRLRDSKNSTPSADATQANRLMRQVASIYRCVGFDGGSLDQ